MNVRINLQGMDDDEAAALLERADRAVDETTARADEVQAAVWRRLGRE